ncbi:septal ring lytic transglycosylase RlpA family protein [Undibacterium sp. RuRC25W]|uniref:septal ring lytic transglycosylase RlpA family protein n=1 Tax=Undibacterium sp. RuRC25W TaxID=3413047 RepID=UPI003BF18CBB
MKRPFSKKQLQRCYLVAAPALFLVACGTAPKQPMIIADTARPVATTGSSSQTPVLPKAGSGKGGYYKDDGPGDSPPQGLESTVDPIPVLEDFSRSANKPYVVFGKTYSPLVDNSTPFIQRGIGSWYGKKFHGQRTSSGELYDMYKITAAHPTLPIPSYARVTNLSNGKQIIVRINDRGPFHSNRIIDLSYTGALKLDLLGKGSMQIEVERLLPVDIARMAENRKNQAGTNVAIAARDASHNQPVSQVPAPQVVQTSATVAKSTSSLGDTISIDDLIASQQGKQVGLADKQEKTTVALPESTADKPSITAAQPVAQPTASSAYYLQFGAYAIRSNAESILNHLKSHAENRLPGFDIVQQGSLYRLVSGPFQSRSEAMTALAQAGDLGVGRPLVVQR